MQMTTQCRADSDFSATEKLTVGTAVATIPYAFFLLANIYDMGGTHGLKFISYFLLAFLIPFARKPLHLRLQEELGIVALFLAWPAFSLYLGLSNGAEFTGDFGALSQATPFLAFFVPLLIVPVLGAQRVLTYLYYAFITMGIAIVIITVLEYQGLAMGYITRIPDYTSAFYSPYFGGIGEHRLYFLATLWLTPTAIYFARTSRFTLAILCLTGLIMAGSRSGAVIVLLFILWILLTVKKYRVVGAISAAIGIALGLFIFPGFIENMRQAFLLADSSALLIRYGHAISAIQVFVDKPWTIFIGNGAGATFYSSGTGAWVVRMETDHLDAIWRYGLVWFVAFTGLCFWTIRRLTRSGQATHKAHGLALLSMYIAGGTNPELISPLFMFYLSACYLIARRLPKRLSTVHATHSRTTLPDAPRHGEARRPGVPLPELGG
jgi:hypothetical protein